MVDDHTVVREALSQLLSREEGLTVVGEAGDGEEAVRLARQLAPSIVIMDIDLPKLDGIEATKKIKQFLPITSVLVLSAYVSEEYILELLEAGASGYLLKDIDAKGLVSTIRAVHAGEFVLHPKVARGLLELTRSSRSTQAMNDDEVLEHLSEREKEVLKMVEQGMTNKEIGEVLFISTRTVEAHMRSIFNKMAVDSRTAAVVRSVQGRLSNHENGHRNRLFRL